MDFKAGGLSGICSVLIPFNAANFSATAGGSWTVSAANVQTYEFAKIGQFVHLDLVLTGGIVAGNPAALLLTIPFIVNNTSTCFMVIDPLGNPSGGMGIIQINTNILQLRPLAGNWGNGAKPLSLEISFA